MIAYWIFAGVALQFVKPYPETSYDRALAMLIGGLFVPLLILDKVYTVIKSSTHLGN